MSESNPTPPTSGDPNIPQAGPDWPAAVVACGHQTGINLARNLQRRGVRVYVIECNPQAECFQSIYGSPLLCPNPDEAPADWLAFMLKLADTIGASGKPVIIPGSDQYVSAIGAHADALEAKFAIPRSAKLQAELALKEGQVRLAMEHGLPIPLTRFASSLRDVEEFADACSYPCLFKPQQHRFWGEAPPGHLVFQKKVVVAQNRAQLLEYYNTTASFTPEVILQEIIQGGDRNKRAHVALYRRDGERIGCATTLLFRTFPKFYGVPSLTEPIDDPEVADACDRFYRSLNYHGICEMELKWDDRDGKVKMMDINPRYTGAGDAMPYAGLDHGWLHYLDLIGKKVEPVRLTNLNFRHLMVRGEAGAVRQYWLDGDITLREVWRTLKRPIYFYDFDWKDRKIAITTLTEVTKVVLLTLKAWAQRGFVRRPL